nr:MAG TPA: holin [Caudoviricetes sp.]
MKEKLLAFKTALAAVFTAIGAFLGWKGVMLVGWIVVMALDYLTGTLAACKSGQWSSTVARDGLWHKGGMIAVVVVAALGDWIIFIIAEHIHLGIQWPGIVLPLVLAWYILTELGSILENAVKMGASVPEWLVKLLKVGKDAVDNAGGSFQEQEEA